MKILAHLASFFLGMFFMWYGLRPFSVCPNPKTMSTEISMTASGPAGVLWECWTRDREPSEPRKIYNKAIAFIYSKEEELKAFYKRIGVKE